MEDIISKKQLFLNAFIHITQDLTAGHNLNCFLLSI